MPIEEMYLLGKRARGMYMTVMNVTTARKNLYRLIQDVNESSQPVTITNSRGKNAVLLSEADWNSIQETIYLNTVPGLQESIVAEEPVEKREIYDPDDKW